MTVIKSIWINSGVCAEGLENGYVRLTCIAAKPIFSPEELRTLLEFSQSVQLELASRQNWKPLPELKPITTELLPAPKP